MNSVQSVNGAKKSQEYHVYRDFLQSEYGLGKSDPSINVDTVDTVDGEYAVIKFTWSAIKKSANVFLTFDPDRNQVVDTEATICQREGKEFSEKDFTLLDGEVKNSSTRVETP